jgi:hypothetical protein
VSLNRYAKRRDANEGEIVGALEQAGAYVHPLDEPCDLLVGFRSRWFMLEVKDGAKPAYDRPLTPAQINFRRDCLHNGLPFAVVLNPSEALAAIGAVRTRTGDGTTSSPDPSSQLGPAQVGPFFTQAET